MVGDIREAQGLTAEVPRARSSRLARTVSGDVRSWRLTVGVDSSTAEMHGDGFVVSLSGQLDMREFAPGVRYSVTLTRLDEVAS